MLEKMVNIHINADNKMDLSGRGANTFKHNNINQIFRIEKEYERPGLTQVYFKFSLYLHKKTEASLTRFKSPHEELFVWRDRSW